MRNRKTILFVIMALTTFLLTGCSSKEDKQTIAELQAAVVDLRPQAETSAKLESELETVNNSIKELQAQIDALTAEKDDMALKLETLYAIEPIEETMYTTSEMNTYSDLYGEILGDEPAGTIPAEQEIKVIGKSNIIDWYETDIDGTKQYISGSLLSTTKPQQQQKPAQRAPQASSQPQQPQQPEDSAESGNDSDDWSAFAEDWGLTEVGGFGSGGATDGSWDIY